jgi:PTH1 family peptidyl-tRNA hydrolase
VIALKPMTFMNESGRAVGEALRFHKLEPADVVVLYDEIELAPGKLRVKQGGGAAGHNGIRSLDDHIGPDFWRVRLGVGHPGVKHLVHPHVLSDFTKEEEAWLDPLLEAVANEAPLLVKGDMAAFMSRVALALQPPKPKKERPKDEGASEAEKDRD